MRNPLDPPVPDPFERQALDSANTSRHIGRLSRRPMLAAVPWRDAALANGFTNFDSGYAPAGFYIDPAGRVFLRGVVTVPLAGAPLDIFVLPEGFRPVYRHAFVTGFPYADSVASAVVSVAIDGTVRLDEGGPAFGGGVSLDPVSFRTL